MGTDNARLPAAGVGDTGIKVATRKVTYSGDADVDFPVGGLGVLSGADDAKTVVDVGPGAGLPVGHDNVNIGSGRKIVAAAGTRVALAASTPAKSVVIAAETDNTGIVVVGSAAGVIAALATRQGIPLNAGDSITLPIDDLADVGLDSTVSGDGVTYLFTS
jgi:hypothetical protein